MTALLIPYEEAWDHAIVAFFQSASAHDATLQPVTADAWRHYTRAGWTHHARSFALAVDDAQCVALLTSFVAATGPAIRHLRIIVHPAWRNQGLGRQLFEHVERLEPGPAGLQTVLPESWSRAERFYRQRRFVCVQEELEMEAALPSLPPATNASITPARTSDCGALADLHNEAYHETFGFRFMTEADMARALGGDGARWFVSRAGDEVVGYCHTERTGDALRIESLVVSSRHRRSGLGRSLLLRACADDAARKASLSVDDDNVAARRLYLDCGFHVTSRTRRLRRPGQGAPHA